ncbi:MAG: PAS domain S-box protein [Desulfobacterales bacterium]|nr:PAS domain S-box protein [Desulfobacterales bacterium]
MNNIESFNQPRANSEWSSSKNDGDDLEENLWESEQLYNMLVETMTDGLIVRDKDGSIVFVNERLCQMWGRPKEELIGHFMTDFLNEENRDVFEAQIAKRQQGIYEPYEIKWMLKDGQLITTIMSPKTIFGSDGNFKGSFAVVTDITARKEAEEALKKQAIELARSNSELEQFAYVSSHDLQEPLRKIQAFGERLRAICGDSINDQGRDYLARMQNAAKRMQVLINDLLTFSRVTTMAKPFKLVDLNQVLQAVLLNLELLIEQTKGRIEFDELPTITGDATQMRQLLQNLIGNALKFRRKDVTPVVKIQAQIFKSVKKKTSENSSTSNVCQITIADNGIGFDEKYADRIFGVFQRLHARDVYEGTGIGLAICRKIVERHHGDIAAKSIPGKGSTFIVTLPIK